MTQYRYLFADLLTNQIIGELPLTDVNFTRQLNSIGSFTGRLLLSGVNAEQMNVSNATVPAKTAVYVDRDGVLVWGGILWGRPYSSETQTLEFQAQEFESYFQHRVIDADAAFTNTDQLTVAQSLVTTAQAAPYGDIGIIVPSNTSGVTIDRVYYGYELKTVYQGLLDLSRSDDGFDFAVEVSYDNNGDPQKELVTAYPRLGQTYSASDPNAPVFEFPAGNIVLYELEEQGPATANKMFVIGAGSNEGKLIESAVDATKYADGWALLERTATYSDYTDTTLLQTLAMGQVAAVSYPPTTFKIVVPPYENPVLGSYNIGDECRLRILDDRFPTGLDSVYRIVALNVEPGEDGPERATLTLAEPTV